MNIFLAASQEDASYLQTFAPLVRGNNNVKFKLDHPTMYAEFIQWCKHYKADAVVITNQTVLEFVLQAQVDFRPPNTRKGITLDDYQGSLLSVRVAPDRVIPAVVLNPLEHLHSVPYGKFLAERFLSKILAPEKWLPDIKFQWKLVGVENAERVCARLTQARCIAVDIETPTTGEWSELRGINCVGYAGLYGSGLGKSPGHPADETYTIECCVFPFDEWSYDYIRRINDNSRPKVTQNGLYDNLYFMRWGLPVRNWYWDTYHLFHSWLAELPKNLGLVSAVSVRNIRYWKDDGKAGDLESYYQYNARDCWATLCALLGLMREAPEWAINNYVDHEFPLVFPCITCELEGIAVDLVRFQEVYVRKMKKQEEDLLTIQEMVGTPPDTLPLATKSDGKIAIRGFNPNSPKQYLQVFTLLGCGKFGSTDKAATLKARALHPLNDRIIGAVSEWKQNAKILGTYVQEYKLWDAAGDGRPRLFYKLDPGGTDTARLASKASSFWCGFQIQNIPARDISVKEYLVADPGWVLGEGDAAQAEARCVGYLSGETKLIDLVESSNDYHSWNASKFFGVPYSTIYRNASGTEPGKTLNKPLRDLSKRTNHGANYNMGEGVMLDTMGPKYVAEAKRLLRLPPRLALKAVCRHLLNVYEASYPIVKSEWYASLAKTVQLSGQLVSALGWTRQFFGRPRDNRHIFNSIVAHSPQNLSVGLINLSFRRIWRDQVYGDLRGRIRLKAQIHDSIFFQFKVGDDEVPKLVQARMIRPVEVKDTFGKVRTMVIPIDMNAGKHRWSELK